MWITKINKVLGDLLGRVCLVHMDDILIMSADLESHASAVRQVLDRLRQAHHYVKARKCKWPVEEVEFLGHTIGRDGLKASPAMIQAVREWPRPQTVSHVLSFLGLATFFRRSVQGFSNVVRPMTNLTRNNVQFVWDARCQQACEDVSTPSRTQQCWPCLSLGRCPALRGCH